MGLSGRRVLAFAAAAGAIASWFFEHLIEHMLFEWIGRAAEPLTEYAVPAFFAVVCVWCMWPGLLGIITGHAKRDERPGKSGPQSQAVVAQARSDFMPMKDAAKLAYTEARRVKSHWAAIAESSADDPILHDDIARDTRILNAIANLIAGLIPIYGEATPSTVREPISAAKDSTSCRFSGGGVLLRFMLLDKTVYKNICVRSEDFDEVMASLDKNLKKTTSI